ncbi:MAG: uracil-xanthine permease [Clostridiales bacterium]|nr:uracil-xanthine permease [Clostridiales bacterium]
MKLYYNVSDRPKTGRLIVFALQQLLAIITATLVVPVIINQTTGTTNMSPAAALFGAGVGTLIYVLFTKAKSPVFLGSSFAFIGSMVAAFSGGVSIALGYLGLIIGATFAGLVYVVIAIVVKLVGVNWISRLMPAAVIGPTVALIGLSLSGNAVSSLKTANAGGHTLVAVLCGLVTLTVTISCATYGKRIGKLIPFIFGILAGYIFAAVLTLIGKAAGVDALMITDFSALTDNFATITLDSFITLGIDHFVFMRALGGFSEISAAYLGTVAVAYVPVAFVVFAEHLADHKNLSSIIEKDLIEDPGLPRTLLGDGIGSIAGAFFGGCPNTTYGESIGCVAITRNASIYSIIYAAVSAIILSFFAPFVAFVNTIPTCVMGGVCMALYGFIAVSGLKMLQPVDLNKNRNLFVVSVILIAGVGGLVLTFGKVTLTAIATALILGILTNLLVSRAKDEE